MTMPGVFEMLKIGIGPSSSHTLGPWRAAQMFGEDLAAPDGAEALSRITVELYGSLALTGPGHGTDIALLMGLSGADPVTVPIEEVQRLPDQIRKSGGLTLPDGRTIDFLPDRDIIYHCESQLSFHANGMIFSAFAGPGREGLIRQSTMYSVGGGFVVREEEEVSGEESSEAPYPVSSGSDLLGHCEGEGLSLAQIIRRNERILRSDEEIDSGLLTIWEVMREAIFRGCRTRGTLPGGLDVSRRAPDLFSRVLPLSEDAFASADEWAAHLATGSYSFTLILKLVGAFAIAVNEENASFGRIVTAPTNGSAGVIPAVLAYFVYLSDRAGQIAPGEIVDFLLVAGAVGAVFKYGATISAAMGGCQAEIGVSSAMAAAALAERLGGTPAQALMAAEIAMEHHLGLTCDPIRGLVQVPCIERNSMGAIKAITAAHLAIDSDASRAKVSLDDVVKTMWATAQDMHSRYKETSLGGLATNVSVHITEC